MCPTPAAHTLALGDIRMQTTVAVCEFIGVDVSKDTLVSCLYSSGRPGSVLNQRSAIEAWLKGLPAGSAIGMEATSTYHELLADLAYSRGIQVYVLNPKDVHRYAKGVGRRAKTDRVDAALLARYIAHEHTKLHLYRPASPEQRQLQRLLTRRAKLSRNRVSVQQSLQGLPGLKVPLRNLLERFDALITAIDARIGLLVNACPQRQAACRRLRSIKGVGPVVAPALLNTFEQFAFKSADSFVAYTGLDPRPDDSGQRTGRRRLSKHGPSELRRLLYNAAMAAVKSAVWKPLYQHHLNKKLSRTAALIIIARKIARTAWSVYTHNTTFDPIRLQSA
jgi:transposase